MGNLRVPNVAEEWVQSILHPVDANQVHGVEPKEYRCMAFESIFHVRRVFCLSSAPLLSFYYVLVVQLARHLNFFMESTEATEARIMVVNNRATEAEKKFCEIKAQTSKVEKTFRQ